VFDALRAGGVGANLHYAPVHLQPYYRKLGFAPGQFPQAEAYGAEAITLPLYPALREAEQDKVVNLLRGLW
jgi:dTDP-4-amino-4,6-dideoxygalactose transaminase